MVLKSLTIWIQILVFSLGCFSLGCSEDPPPATYEPSNTSSNPQDEDDNDFTKGDDDDDSTSFPTTTSSFDCGGATVDESEDEDLAKCHGKGAFYDRFTGDAPECTRHDLAPVDCTVSGIKKLMSDKQKTDFENALDDQLSAYKIDQCLYCPEDPSSSLGDFCKIKDEVKTGVKIFLIAPDEKETGLVGTAIRIPNLPDPVDIACKGSSSSSSSDDDDDDDDDDDSSSSN